MIREVPRAELRARRAAGETIVVTACGKGGGRSEGAAAALAAAGAADVGFLAGGTLGWLAET